MKKIKMVMGTCSVLTILLIAKLSVAEPNPPNLEIQPVAHSQVVGADNQSYTVVEETVVEAQSQ